MKTLQENLKNFYLGLEGDEPFLYKNKDLTTHALIIGMTGSGKTGLGITLLEEACIDNIPSIVIDPKGDMTNLALAFEDMKSEDFLPFIDENEAANKGKSVESLAQETAQIWKDGIENSYQDLERVKLLKNSVDVRIYTPKSSAGLGVSLLSDFEAPVGLNDEDLNNYVLSITSGVLSLAGIKSDDFSSPEMLLIQKIFITNFTNGKNVTIAELINQIATPPFEKVGVFDVNSFYPSDKRMALAMKINALIASPSFSKWCEGERLNIAKMLFGSDGKARCNIFTISHLNDSERMFFVTLLLNEIINWMRSSEGTSALRAILYMDEIFGFFPPNANPPSKTPMLTLLKQARAFGLGCVLSTQNPVDLDYKGLSNIGSWFIGRLQTAQDKERVIDGLLGVGTSGSSKSELTETISNLAKRNFLVKNINEDSLKIISTRFALSYLKGPLSSEQISDLMKNKKSDIKITKTTHASGIKPMISTAISEIYSGDGDEFSPYLYGVANVRYSDTKGLDYTQKVELIYDLDDTSSVAWDEASVQNNLNYTQAMPKDAKFSNLPSFVAGVKDMKEFERNFKDFLYRNQKLSLYSALDLISVPGESKEEFYIRLSDKANEILEAKTADFQEKFDKERARLEKTVRTAEERVEREKSNATAKGIDTLVSIGTAVLGSFFGRSRTSTNIGKAATALKQGSRVLGSRNDVKNAEENLAIALNDLDTLTQRFNDEIADLREQYDVKNLDIKIKEISPKKSDIFGEKVMLLWRS